MTMTKASNVNDGPSGGVTSVTKRKHCAGGADAGRTETEGQCIEMRHVEAYDLRAGVVVGAGADRGAEPGEAEECKQRRRNRNGCSTGEGFGCVDDKWADHEAVESVGCLDAASVRAEHDQQAIGQNNRDSDQQYELTVFRPADERIDQPTLHGIAEYEQNAGDRQHHQQGIKAEAGEQDHSEIHRDGRHLTVGKIDHADHAENHGEAERHQAVDKAGQDAAHGNVEIDISRHNAPAAQRSDRGSRGRSKVKFGASAALVVWRHRPLDFGIGRDFRRHRDEFAAAILDRRVLQLVVLAFFVELNAGTGADVVGDVGLANGVGQRFGIGRARALECVSRNQQRLKRIDLVGVEIDPRMGLGERLIQLLAQRLVRIVPGHEAQRTVRKLAERLQILIFIPARAPCSGSPSATSAA